MKTQNTNFGGFVPQKEAQTSFQSIRWELEVLHSSLFKIQEDYKPQHI